MLSPDITKEQTHKDLSILFVEDELLIALYIVKNLKTMFGKVLSAVDGQEGLEIFEKQRPDIVVTDILMPSMDGFEMIARIREISPHTPVIIMTAINDKYFRQKAEVLQIQGYFVKPINEKDFFDAVCRIADELESE